MAQTVHMSIVAKSVKSNILEYFSKMAGKILTFWSWKCSTHHGEYLEWSHNRVLINSKFHFLPENEILQHFLEISSKTFHSFLTEDSSHTSFLIVDELFSKQNFVDCFRQAFIQPQLNYLTLLQFILMLRTSEHMLWIQSMPRVP